jgi:two-component system sensor histidine kinase ChiS
MITEGRQEVELPKMNSKEANQLAQALLSVEHTFVRERQISANLEETKCALEQTVAELQTTKLLLEQSNANLEEKVSERTLELAKSLQIKTDILNNISHEIRTPVQGITVIASSLAEMWDELDEEKRKQCAMDVAWASNRLFSLMNNLLDLSKVSAGKMVINRNLINLKAMIEEVIAECSALYIGNKDIKLEFVVKEDAKVSAYLDQERMMQVLRNLFANAIKFTKSGVVKANLSLYGTDQILFTLDDEGPGIKDDELTAIFEPFVQGTLTDTGAGGAGLGLAICKEIVVAHNGRIWAENLYPKGAKFSLLLPIGDKAVMPEPATAVSHVVTSLPAKGLNVMVVDDEEICHRSLSLILGKMKANCVHYYGGREALAYLQDHAANIDVIMLDLMMPDMYGINVLKAIKSSPATSHIAVVIQSGGCDKREEERAFLMGASAYLYKPYKNDVIESTINKILRKTES